MKRWIYHERQESALCGQHCLNNLLQYPYFSADMLAEIAQQLDQMERSYMLEAGVDTTHAIRFLAEDSGNVDDSGNFSIQVLRTAVERFHNLRLISWTSDEIRDTVEDPTIAQGFICNRNEHWFCVRKIRDNFWNLNSVENKPVKIGGFFLSAFLAQLREDGYSVFVVDGPLPDSSEYPMEGGGRSGKWWDEDQLLSAPTATGNRNGQSRWNMFEGVARHIGSMASSIIAPRQDDAEFEEQLMLARALSMEGSTTSEQQQEDTVDTELELALALSMAAAQPAPNRDNNDNSNDEGEGLLSLQIKLPNGEKLLRRFRKTDSLGDLSSFVVQHVNSHSLEYIVAGHRLPSDEPHLTLEQCGIEDNTCIAVRSTDRSV